MIVLHFWYISIIIPFYAFPVYGPILKGGCNLNNIDARID